MLPSVGGFDVLRELGASHDTPILMLTARGDDVDRIVGLELGADDYLEQAVQSARTGGAHARHPAPREQPRGARRGAGRDRPSGPIALNTGMHQVRVARSADRAHRRGIPRARAADALRGPGDLARGDDRTGARPQARPLRPQHRHAHQQSAPQARTSRPARIRRSRTSAAPATRSRWRLRSRTMHSLFLRIFVLFWIAMALIVGGSIAVTFTVAAREYESRGAAAPAAAVAIQASEVLGRRRRRGAEEVARRPTSIRSPIAICTSSDPTAATFSAGACPKARARRLEFFNREAMSNRSRRTGEPPDRSAAGNFRPQRAAPQIVGPDGSTYTVLLGAAPAEHLRRPEPARHLADDSVHRAGGERLRELVAGAALERAHPPHPGGRAGARQRESRRARRQGCASARDSRAARTNWRCSPAISTPWRIG